MHPANGSKAAGLQIFRVPKQGCSSKNRAAAGRENIAARGGASKTKEIRISSFQKF